MKQLLNVAGFSWRLVATVLIVLSFTAMAGTAPAQTYTLAETLLNPTPEDLPPERGDAFGTSVAGICGNVLVGADFDNTGAADAGSVYLFDGEPSSPTFGELLHTFANPTPGAQDAFGISVAALGCDLLIGAPGDDTAGTDAGAIYLFRGTPPYDLLCTFLNPDPSVSPSFGFSVAEVCGRILGGAPEVGAGGGGDAVHLFDGPPSCTFLHTYVNPTLASFDQFGVSVAAVGCDVIIGAVRDDAGATDAGAAHLFSGSAPYDLLHTFENPEPAVGDWFGTSVAGLGGNVLVGAMLDDTGANNAGKAYLFRGAAPYDRLCTLENPTPEIDDELGNSVAALGGNILVGASDDSATFVHEGAVYLFAGTPPCGVMHRFKNPTPAMDDHFGKSVAAVGGNVVVGANDDNIGGSGAGVAYIFDECGNGVLTAGEQCDDGNTTPGDGCDKLCQIEQWFCCNAGNPCNHDSACPDPGDACCMRHCDTGMTPPVCDGLGDPCATGTDCGAAGVCCGVCGNGLLDEGEKCDLGAGNGASDCLCSLTCTIPGRCTDTGACCEDDAACLPGGTCCGNGVTTAPEECDDGNLLDGDCCSDQCLTEATCVPACPGFRGPNIMAATVKKRAQFWDKDEDPQDLIERYKSKGDFNFFAGQVRRFDPERQPVRITYAQNDGSGGRVLLFDPGAILPGDCSVLPLGAPCFPRVGRIGRHRWNMVDKEELVELGVRKLQFKQKDNKIQYRALGRKAEMVAPVVELGPNQSLIRQDITVGPFCATVLLGCEEFQNKKGTKTKWKCVAQ